MREKKHIRAVFMGCFKKNFSIFYVLGTVYFGVCHIYKVLCRSVSHSVCHVCFFPGGQTIFLSPGDKQILTLFIGGTPFLPLKVPSHARICYRRLITCFSDPLQETHCLFLGSVTGDYCLFLGSFYPANFSLIRYFKGEGGL